MMRLFGFFFGPQLCNRCKSARPLSELVAERSPNGVLVGFHCVPATPDEHTTGAMF